MSDYLDILLVAAILLASCLYLTRLAVSRFTGRSRACSGCGPADSGVKRATLTIAGRAVTRH